jgi:excisionase family DNA binding protein
MTDRLRAVPARLDKSTSSSTFDLLLDDLAEQIAQRVISKVEDYLGSRAPTTAAPAALRTDEAARALGLSLRETKRLVAAGELQSVKVGRARLIARQAIDDFLNGRAG